MSTVYGNQLAIQVKTSPYPSGIANALLWLPDDYQNTTKDYPLIIFLHGVGEKGSTIADLQKLCGTGLPQRIANGFKPAAFAPDGTFTKFIVCSPQSASWSEEEPQIKYILPDLQSRYRIDANRIYITGLSAGGEGAWSCICNEESFCSLLAAVAPISAAPTALGANVTNAAKYNVGVWAIIQATDSNGFTPPNQAYIAAINAQNPANPARITIIPGTGHGAWNWGYDPAWFDPADPKHQNLYTWLLNYSKGKTIDHGAVAFSNISITAPGIYNIYADGFAKKVS